MPELTWVGKEKVITHHLDVPYRLLDRQYSFDETGQHEADNGSENIIIHGDNLEALKALLPKYEGKVDCIYIDPPYNTGEEKWVYNDAVNDPRVKKWLGEVVGKEGEDLSRHDKWLCMMYPRLRLLSRLLSPRGSLAISLSHHELSNLIGILNEVFAARRITITTVQTSGGKPSGGFNYVHEFLIFVTPRDFEPNASTQIEGSVRSPFEGLTLSTFDKTQRPNQVYPIFIDTESLAVCGVGPSLQQLIDDGVYSGELSDYAYATEDIPEGCEAVWPITAKGKECVWRQVPDRLLHDWEKGFIKVTRNSSRISIQYLPSGVIQKIDSGLLEVIGSEPGLPTLRFGENRTAGTQISTLHTSKDFFTVFGSSEFGAIFPENSKVFSYPKPTPLVEYVVETLAPRDGIVLDSFAGSGTTAQAVLNLNKRDHGDRRFILVELGDYADGVTAERARRTINGFKETRFEEHVLFEQKLTLSALKKGQDVLAEAAKVYEGAQGQYTKVSRPKVVTKVNGRSGTPFVQVIATQEHESDISGTGGSFSFYELGALLLVDGNLNPEVPLEHVREYIWFTETTEGYRSDVVQAHPDFLGRSSSGTSYFFAFDSKVPTVLDGTYLASIPAECAAETYVIYADTCLLPEQELVKYNITFKKVPRDITRL